MVLPAKIVYIFQSYDLRLEPASHMPFLLEKGRAVRAGKLFCSAVHDKIPSPRESLELGQFR